MKTKLILIIIMAATLTTFAQIHRQRGKDAMAKIEELEKVKLIEVLNMDEQTTLKFFARRTEHMNKIKELNTKSDELLEKISDSLKNENDKNSTELKKMIADYLTLGNAVSNERINFINSLNDILSYRQISKLLVFEKRFREELRGILFKQRMKGKN